MGKLLTATAMATLLASGAYAESHSKEVKLGVILSFTGPIESLTPHMADSAELAVAEVNESGLLLDGSTVMPVRADGTCIDAGAATAAAERLVTADKVHAIMGADCSGITGAILANVAMPNGVLMISPSATSPGLSTAEDNGLFFRVAPSDARQGAVMSDIMMGRDVTEVAVTYTNNDYGKGLADAFIAAYEAAGGKITINAPHEDGKGDYSAEIGALASAGGQALVVAGYVDQGGSGVVQAAIDTGAFETFVFPDGMVGTALEEKFGTDINGSFGQNPAANSDGAAILEGMATDAGFDGSSPFAKESYDAAALIMLAMQAAKSPNSGDFKDHVMDVANAPGEKILPGELAKGLQILADGGEIDYDGASAVELIEPGEAAGTYREFEIQDGKITTIGYR